MPSESVGDEGEENAARRQQAEAKLRAFIEENAATLNGELSNFARKRTGKSREDALEIASEALNEAVSRILDNPGKYDPDRPACPWIISVGIRVIGERTRPLKARTHRKELSANAWRDIEDREGETRASNQVDLKDFLDQLKPCDREALILSHIHELTGAALAAAMGVASESTALARVYRALRRAKAIAARGEMNP